MNAIEDIDSEIILILIFPNWLVLRLFHSSVSGQIEQHWWLGKSTLPGVLFVEKYKGSETLILGICWISYSVHTLGDFIRMVHKLKV